MPLDHLFEATIITKLSLIIFISTLINWLSPPFIIIIILLSVLFLDLENILQPVVLLFIKQATLSMWHNYNVTLIVWTWNRECRNISLKIKWVLNFTSTKTYRLEWDGWYGQVSGSRSRSLSMFVWGRVLGNCGIWSLTQKSATAVSRLKNERDRGGGAGLILRSSAWRDGLNVEVESLNIQKLE